MSYQEDAAMDEHLASVPTDEEWIEDHHLDLSRATCVCGWSYDQLERVD